MKRPSFRPESSSVASPSPLARGAALGQYTIEKRIARGGMGEVYHALDPRLGRAVALKVLRGHDAHRLHSVDRFEREREAIASLCHPGIVALYDAGKAVVVGEPVFYIAMELVEGPSLAAVLIRGRLPLRRSLELATGIAEALAAVHQLDIAHRDLKPSNILVSEDGEGPPKIVDFGLAKQSTAEDREAARHTLTATGEVVGTAGYMSPEQARGEPVVCESDQFAFGCIVYEMLTGRRAFDAGSFAETLSSVLRDEPAPIEAIAPEVPVPLRWIVERCLTKKPAQRYHSTLDLARDLRTLRDSYAELLSGPHAPPPRRSWRDRSVFAGGLLAVGVAAAFTWPRPPPDARSLEFRPLTFRSGLVARALFTPRSNGFLFAASWEGEPLRMYQTMVESVGFDRPLDSPVQFPLAYSEDGAQVLVLLGVTRDASILRGTLAWWPALGGTPRPVMEDAGWADWAPRSRQLAVVRDEGSSRILELRDANGRVIRSLHSTPGAITWVQFSPDEERIAFIRLPSPYGTRGEVWSVDVASGAARALTPLMSQCRGLDWDGATGEIWFTASRENPWTSVLCRLRSDGTIDYVQALPGAYHLQAVDAARAQWLITSHEDDSDIVVSVPPRPPERRRWFGWSVASDLSPDARSYLFFDGGAGADTWGLWIRPIEGGDAYRIGGGTTGSFSPDGRWVVATSATTNEPAQIRLLPVGAGEARTVTSGTASYSWPSFETADSVLAVRHDGQDVDVARVRLGDGHVEPLGLDDCDLPSASRGGGAIACVAMRVATSGCTHARGPRRTVATLDKGRIKVIRWHRDGAQLYAVTMDRRLLTVDTRLGQVSRTEQLQDPGGGPYDRLIGGAIDDRGQAPDLFDRAIHFRTVPGHARSGLRRERWRR